MLKEGQIHSGMFSVVFAVNKPQKKRRRLPYHRRGTGRKQQVLFRHGTVAPRLIDRCRPSTTPSDKQQHSRSSSSSSSGGKGGGGGGDGDGPAR